MNGQAEIIRELIEIEAHAKLTVDTKEFNEIGKGMARQYEKSAEFYKDVMNKGTREIEKFRATQMRATDKEQQKYRIKAEKEFLETIEKFAANREDRTQAYKKRLQLELQEQWDKYYDAQMNKEEMRATIKFEKEKKRIDDLAKRQEQKIKDLSSMASDVATAVFNRGVASINKGLESYIGVYSKYFSSFETRMLGTGRGYNSMMSGVGQITGGSAVVKQTAILEKIEEYLQKGVTSNVEVRATIAAMTDKIAATFDPLNATLLDLGRIMQEDQTQNRLGIEHALTKFFNQNFGDSSYLATNVNETVREAIYEATTQLSASQGAEIEYQLQRWLGSFSSVGVGNDTLTKLARSVGYLGSGNVSAFTQDQEMMNMLVGAANRGGADIGQILSQGLTVDSINKLMRGIYEQASSINGSGDNIVRSQYASLFGMNISDLIGFGNISSSMANLLGSGGMSRDQLDQTTVEAMRSARTRTHISELIDNAFSNTFAEMGEGIAKSPAMLSMWKVLSMIGDTGGIQMPAFLGMGTGLSQFPNIDQLMKTGIGLFSALGNIGSVLGALSGTGQINLNAGAQSVSSYSNELLNAFAESGNAGATFIGDMSKESMLKGSLAEAMDMVTLSGQDTNEEADRPMTEKQGERLIELLEESVRLQDEASGGVGIVNTPNSGKW